MLTTARIHCLLLSLAAVLGLVMALAPSGALAQAAAAPSSSEDAGAPLLARGSVGPEVERVQQQLNAWMEQDGAERAPLAVDGIFGPRTEGATMAFQGAHGLTVDGLVGPRTRAALQATVGDGVLHAKDVLSDAIDTRPDTGDASGPPVSVTDVRVGAHHGFDRVTFEIGGEGEAGWDVRYVAAARSQGSGRPVPVAGETVLSVNLSNIAYPINPPVGVDPWEGPDRLPVGDSGPILEVVADTVFEGYHTFFIGVTGEQPFQVRRFDSPQRVVVDVAASDTSVSVFFNAEQDATCTAVEPVERHVGETKAVATAALTELFKGPTDAEQDRGLTSFFHEGTSDLLRSVHVEEGTAYVDLDREFLDINNASTSCGSIMIRSSIEATLTQFSTVEDVRYAIEGEPSAFYDFMQMGCPRPRSDGDRCDPAPFQP